VNQAFPPLESFSSDETTALKPISAGFQNLFLVNLLTTILSFYSPLPNATSEKALSSFNHKEVSSHRRNLRCPTSFRMG